MGNLESYFYNCSREYVDSVSPSLFDEIATAIAGSLKRATQSQLNADLFWLLVSQGWSFDAKPAGTGDAPPQALGVSAALDEVRKGNVRDLCLTSTTLGARWHADFAKILPGGLAQVEVQFSKTEAMFKDFCGFEIAYSERRLALGIEIVMLEPGRYFEQRKAAISGMARYSIARDTLSAIGLTCPIWLIGMQ